MDGRDGEEGAGREEYNEDEEGDDVVTELPCPGSDRVLKKAVRRSF